MEGWWNRPPVFCGPHAGSCAAQCSVFKVASEGGGWFILLAVYQQRGAPVASFAELAHGHHVGSHCSFLVRISILYLFVDAMFTRVYYERP